MQEEFHSEDVEATKKRPTTNLDYSFNRCKTEKLQEQMSQEKAVTILKIPTGRGGIVPSKKTIDAHFVGMLHTRHKILPNDPNYESKVENRHVIDVLVHESFQYMMKHGQWKEEVIKQPGNSDEITRKEVTEQTIASKLANLNMKKRRSKMYSTNSSTSNSKQNSEASSRNSSRVSSRSSSRRGSETDSPTNEWKAKKAQGKLTKSNFDLRRAIQRQEEESKSRNVLIQRMIDTYMKEDQDPVVNANVTPFEYKPKIAFRHGNICRRKRKNKA